MPKPCVLGFAVVAACSFDSTGGGSLHGSSTSTGEQVSSSSDTASRPESETDSTGSDASAGADAEATTSTHGLDGSSSTGQDEGSETTAAAPRCDRALWVTGNTDVANTVDAPLVARMVDLGFSIAVVNKAASSADDVGDHCVVVISDVGSSGDVNTKFRDVPVGVVVLEAGLYHFMAMVPTSGDAWWGDDDGLITIVAPEHPLAAGLDGTVATYEGPARGNHASPVESVQVIAIWGGDFGGNPGATAQCWPGP